MAKQFQTLLGMAALGIAMTLSSSVYAQVATTLEQAEMAGLSPEVKADISARYAKGGQTVYELLKTDMLNNLQVKLNFQQAALGQVSDVAANLKQTLINALANGQGEGIMTDVNSYFSQAVQAINAQYGGDYLFSGGQTQTKPFTATAITQLVAAPPGPNPAVSSFFQNGNLTPNNRVDDQTTIPTGFLATDVGQQIMQIFQDIQTFQQSAGGNFGGQLTQAQQTFLQNEITTLDGVVTATTQTTANGGDIQKRVETATQAQSDRQTTLKNVLGDITDVNMAQAATDLSQAQSAVQASAQVFLALKGMSLLNYLSPGG